MTHPALSNPANNPNNGHSWSSATGTVIDEARTRMAMITEYPCFMPADGFRFLVNETQQVIAGGSEWYKLELSIHEKRDAWLMCMGL